MVIVRRPKYSQTLIEPNNSSKICNIFKSLNKFFNVYLQKIIIRESFVSSPIRGRKSARIKRAENNMMTVGKLNFLRQKLFILAMPWPFLRFLRLFFNLKSEFSALNRYFLACQVKVCYVYLRFANLRTLRRLGRQDWAGNYTLK